MLKSKNPRNRRFNLDVIYSNRSPAPQPAEIIVNLSAARFSIPSQCPQVFRPDVPDGRVTEANIQAVFVASHDVV